MAMAEVEEFGDKPAPADDGAAFVVDIDGFEGPIDMLLALAREQKVDLKHISILALADQYLAFVARARHANLELAADYLVMAAWLAYLKSRLLLPELGGEEEPSGEELAAALAFQLRRLEAMQQAGQGLMARNRLGREFWPRGAPEEFKGEEKTVIDLTLFDLLSAYGGLRRHRGAPVLRIESSDIFTVEDSVKRLVRMLGGTADWESLWRFLPDGPLTGLVRRSAIASTFAASLELAKAGRVRIRQASTYGPIYLRASFRGEGDDT